MQVNDAIGITKKSLALSADGRRLIVGFPGEEKFQIYDYNTDHDQTYSDYTTCHSDQWILSADSETGIGLLDGAVADAPMEFGRDVKLSEDGRTALVSGSAPPGQLRLYILNGTEWRQRGSTLEQ